MEHITNGKIKVKCSSCGKEFIKWKAELHKDNFHERSCYFEFIRKGKHKIIGQSAERHPNWHGGRIYVNADGYRMVWCPGHPRSHQNVVSEHTLVLEKKIGRFLESSEEVHHINGVGTDNRPENLELCKNHSEHLKSFRHKQKTAQLRDKNTGRFVSS